MSQKNQTSRIAVMGYCRCSSIQQVQDGESIPRQKELIEQYCKIQNLGAPTMVVDEGVSGFRSSRPGFQDLLRQCRTGNVSHIVVTDLSRLSRSVRDTLQFVDEVVQKYEVRLISLTQDLDTGTPFGRAFLTFIAVFAQLYRDEIAFKTKVALAHKKAKGERYTGYLPYGFDDNGNGKLVPSEADQRLMEVATIMRIQGHSLRKIGQQLTELGFKTKTGRLTWNAKTVRDVLNRAVTIGVQK